MSSNNQEAREQNAKKVSAVSSVYEAIKELDAESAIQVLKIVADLVDPKSGEQKITNRDKPVEAPRAKGYEAKENTIESTDEDGAIEEQAADHEDAEDEFGLSAQGARWLKRNNIEASSASAIFSLGADEIEVVSNSIPGTSSAGKLRESFLLQGVTALLATGSPRFKHEDAKELCEHYGAWDPTNATKYIKRISSLVSGSRSTGYQLTAKGLLDAANLIKQMLGGEKN
ncbi:MAG: hypothetical protein ACXWR1_18695 [Bdellovibrionota bacterium]